MFYLFSLNIFLSSFLIFLIQPIFTKLTLPHLGNTPLIWNCSMIFYQTLLLIGYFYAYLLSRIKFGKLVTVIHWIILMVSLLSIPIELKYYQEIDRFGTPHLWLFSSLLISIGVVFFTLSSNTPLSQSWFALTQSDQRKTYNLYSISNFGNLLALILYPLLSDLLSLPIQQQIFSFLYLCFILSVIPCSYHFIKQLQTPQKICELNQNETSLLRVLRWILLSFIPASLMIGVTSQLTENLSNSAIFWLLPLALYLLSYILAFLPKPPLLKTCTKLVPFITFVTIFVALQGYTLNYFIVSFFLLSFFLVSYVLTANLASLVPSKNQVTLFYLIISFGSILGSIFNSLIAPLQFTVLLEYPLINLVALLIFTNLKPNRISRLISLSIIVVFAFLLYQSFQAPSDTLLQERNFFGINRITKTSDSKRRVLTVANKRLNYEYNLAPLKQLGSLTHSSGKNIQVGAINNHFCQIFAGSFDYFEPNQFITDILNNGYWATGNASCRENYKIYLGDPRMLLTASRDQNYQAIIFDLNSLNSFDHLITLQALKKYKLKLSVTKSFILFVFNPGLDQLKKNLADLAAALNLKAYFKESDNQACYLVMLGKEDDSTAQLSSWQTVKGNPGQAIVDY